MNADSTNLNESKEDQPLDPAVERVRAKMMRMMGISVAIMVIGLGSVIGAIIYKFSNRGADEAKNTRETGNVQAGSIDVMRDISGEIQLPSGSVVIDTQLANDRILLHIRGANGEKSLWIYDLGANRIFAKISISR